MVTVKGMEVAAQALPVPNKTSNPKRRWGIPSRIKTILTGSSVKYIWLGHLYDGYLLEYSVASEWVSALFLL